MHIRGALVAAAIVCACGDCGALAQTADVRIDLTPAWLVLAPVELHGAPPRHFVVDTGATTTMLDARVATALGLAPTGTLRMLAASGAFSATSGIVSSVKIGSISVERLPVSWTRLDRLRPEDARIMGVIGQDVLSRLTMTIDYPRRRLRLDDRPCPAGDAMVEVDRVDGRPAIAAVVQGPGGARRLRLVIDSGANALVLFEQSGAGSVRTHPVPLITHAGGASASAIPGAKVTIAGLAFKGAAIAMRPTEVRGEDGLLPASWFSRVCIDGPRAAAVLTR